LDIQILQAILSGAGSREKGAGRNILQAPLTSTPLIAILNGDFSIDDSSNPQFGWQTRGDSTIVAEQAILREDSPFLSNFTQSFTIPEGAKILQFTIANTQLSPNSQFIPDAFEVALLDAQTLNPLVAPALSLSDSFLNRQPQLLTYKSENVKVSGKINSPQWRIYDQQGDLIYTHGGLFDSPLHFIGFSRGTVVNSEIIQRLGSYYPHAGGPIDAERKAVKDAEGKPIRNLQMTTIDPHDFYQPSLPPFYQDFHEPKVQVWENVTFADNYYQTLGGANSLPTLTPNGRDLPHLPLAGIFSISLGALAGIT
jgi:hypothetical protein